MICVSRWYTNFSNYTFPTVFIRLKDDEIQGIIQGHQESNSLQKLRDKINKVIGMFSGKSFLNADCCAPTDSISFQKRYGAINNGDIGVTFLLESEKVRMAFQSKKTERIAIHPYRRMNRMREFRVFIYNQKTVAVSQRHIDNYYPKLEAKKNIFPDLCKLFSVIGWMLPDQDMVVDVYLTSKGEWMIISMNSWGIPTDPLLLQTWERDWQKEIGIKMITKPVSLKGDISISF